MDFQDLIQAQFDSTTDRFPPLGDTTLRNPLIKRVIDVLNGRVPDVTGACNGMLREAKTCNFSPGPLQPDYWLYTYLGSSLALPSAEQQALFDNMFRDVITIAADTLSPLVKPAVSTPTSLPQFLYAYLHSSFLLTEGILKTSTKDFSHPRVRVIQLTSKHQIMLGFYCAELRHLTSRCIVPRDFVLMISDLINSRTQTLVWSYLSELIGQPTSLSCHQLLDLFKSGDMMMAQLGQKGFHAIKLIEPYATARLVELDPTSLHLSSFPDYVRSEIRQLNSNLVDHFFSTIRSMTNTPEQCSEIFGMFRLWGHPILDSDLGRDRVKQVATANKTYNQEDLDFAFNAYKKWVILGYIQKTGVWPKLDVSALPEDDEIAIAYKRKAKVRFFSKSYNNNNWIKVKGMQTFSLPTCLNLAILLADKSHSLTRQKLIDALYKTNKPGSSTERRVLLTALKETIPTVEEILSIFGGTDLNNDYLMIGLREKEREVSPYARLFGLMTLPMRMYFVLTEYMISKNLLPLFPESTMADNSLTVKKKKLRITTQMSDPTSQYIYFVLNSDFEKWNLNMRAENTQPAFQFNDELFGTNLLFQNSHKIFEQSTMYMVHGVHPLLEHGKLGGPNVWTGHKGGIEGLRQKGWTLITIAVLKELAWTHQVSASIMGQGDNQVIAVRVNLLDRSQQAIDAAQSQFKRFREDLFKRFAGIGLPLKPSETWISDRLFAYGKDLYYSGRKLPLSFKRASRCYFLVNEGYPSLHDFVSSVSSSIVTLNDECSSLVPPWFFYVFNLTLMILHLSRYHPLLRRSIKLIPQSILPTDYSLQRVTGYSPQRPASLFSLQSPYKLLYSLCSARSAVSGLPSIIPLDLIMHGNPDSLTLSLTWTHALIKSCRRKDLIPYSHWDPPLDTNANPIQLCEDPVSIPLAMPQTVSNCLRGAVRRYLSSPYSVKNKSLRKFFDISCQKQDDLARALFNIEPCNPRLMADIFAATPVGQATAVISQITTTTTLNRIVYQTEGDSLVERLQTLELTYLGYISWLWTRTNFKSDTQITCPTMKARELRRIGWGKDIIITVPHPMHFLKPTDLYKASSSIISVRCVIDSPYQRNLTPGPFPIYLGSSTSEKLPPNQVISNMNLAPLISRPVALCRMIGWICESNSKLAHLIHKVLSASTDIPSWLLINEDLEVTGCAEHRYSDQRTPHMTNVAGNGVASTRCCVSVAGWTKYCKGSKNVTIHFQSIFAYLSRLVYERLLSSVSLSQLYWFEEGCTDCIRPTYEGYYDLPTSFPFVIPSFPELSTLYLKMSSVSISQCLTLKGTSERSDISLSNISFSLGLAAVFYGFRLNVVTSTLVDGVYTMIGFALGLVTSALVDYCIMHDFNVSKSLQRVYRDLVYKILDYDLSEFEAIALLMQYSPSISNLLTVFGRDLISPEIPLTSASRLYSSKNFVGKILLNIDDLLGLLSNVTTILLEGPAIEFDKRIMLISVAPKIPLILRSADWLTTLKKLVSVSQGLAELTDGYISATTLYNAIAQCKTYRSILPIVTKLEIMNATYAWALKQVPPAVAIDDLSYVGSYNLDSSSLVFPTVISLAAHSAPIHMLKPRVVTPASNPIKDHTNFLSFALGTPTSSWYKWMAVIDYLGLDLSRPACLAEGAGGVARACYDRSSTDSQNRVVFYNTRPYGPMIDEFSIEEYHPIMLAGLRGVYGLSLLRSGVGDLSQDQEVVYLIKALQQYRPSTITCDAETSPEFSNVITGLVPQLIKIFKVLQVPVVFKTYLEPQSVFNWIIHYLYLNGVSPTVVQTPLSPRGSSECFIRMSSSDPQNVTVQAIHSSPKLNDCTIDELCMRLSMWRLPAALPPIGHLVDIYRIHYGIHDWSSYRSVLKDLLSHAVRRTLSRKYFPTLFKTYPGTPHFLSSDKLSLIYESLILIDHTDSLLNAHSLLTKHRAKLHLTQIHNRLVPTLCTSGVKCDTFCVTMKRDKFFFNNERRIFRILALQKLLSNVDLNSPHIKHKFK